MILNQKSRGVKLYETFETNKLYEIHYKCNCFIILIINLFNIAFAYNEEEYAISEYTVMVRDTFWQVAEENKAENTEIGKYIYEPKELNTLNDCNIKTGQTINIKKLI